MKSYAPKGANLKERLLARNREDQNTGCWIWIGTRTPAGYGRLTISNGKSGGKSHDAHRLSWQVFRGDIPEGMCVLHKCDNPACINPEHLFLGTFKDNMQDCIKKGRWGARREGEAVFGAKLTEEQVRWIRQNPYRWTQTEMAKHLRVDQSIVSRAANKRNWRHVS